MYDKDQEMMDYIDENIVRDRTSDAAEDSAGAAWASYERGEFSVPEWYSKEYRQRSRSPLYNAVSHARESMAKPSFSFESFLKSMGVLFLAIIVLFLIFFTIGYFAK